MVSLEVVLSQGRKKALKRGGAQPFRGNFIPPIFNKHKIDCCLFVIGAFHGLKKFYHAQCPEKQFYKKIRKHLYTKRTLQRYRRVVSNLREAHF